MIIGITGTDGAGKGTVVDYLVSQHGFTHYSSRDLIVAEIERRGLPSDRNHMRLVANDLRATHGNAVIVKRALEHALAEQKDLAVIESIRALDEALYLKENGGILLAIDADPRVRYARVQARRSATDQVTYEQFIAHEELEKNDPDPHGMQKAKVMEMADYTINNTASVAELQAAVDEFLASLGK